MDDLLQQLKSEQRNHWLAGKRISVRAYLEKFPQLRENPSATLELIRNEIQLRLQLNESLQEQEYLEAFPQYSEQIRKLLGFDQLLGHVLPGLGTSTDDCSDGSLKLVGTGNAITPSHAAPVPANLPRLPGYEILQELGVGGRGRVYLARQLSLGRLVAIKFIADSAGMSQREAMIAGNLTHPNLVTVHEFGEHEGRHYILMEYLCGGTLRQKLAAAPSSADAAAALLETLARAMHEVHLQRVVHRDLKPANILFDENDVPKIADFGLARLLDAEHSILPTVAIAGTVGYMAPEQAAGHSREAGEAADIYALGVILYEMLAGELPFGGTVESVLAQTRSQEPPPLRGRGVPQDLETICLKCLEKKPEARYVSAAELADRLRQFLERKPIPDPPRTWSARLRRKMARHPWAVAASVLLFGAAATVPFYRQYTDPDRTRRQAEATLAAGNEYVFHGHEPLPGPWRWVTGDPVPLRPNAREGCFSFETYQMRLLELVSDPGWDRYRLMGEFRHEDAGGGESFLGLYVNHRSHTTAEGTTEHGYLTLAYADRGSWAKTATGPKKELKSRVRVHARFTASDRPDANPHASTEREYRFDPEHPLVGHSPWRRMVLDVTPEGVVATWENLIKHGPPEKVLVTTVSASSARQAFLNAMPMKWKPDDLRFSDVPVDFRTRTSIGVFLNRGVASFRSIRVVPL